MTAAEKEKSKNKNCKNQKRFFFSITKLLIFLKLNCWECFMVQKMFELFPLKDERLSAAAGQTKITLQILLSLQYTAQCFEQIAGLCERDATMEMAKEN